MEQLFSGFPPPLAVAGGTLRVSQIHRSKFWGSGRSGLMVVRTVRLKCSVPRESEIQDSSGLSHLIRGRCGRSIGQSQPTATLTPKALL